MMKRRGRHALTALGVLLVLGACGDAAPGGAPTAEVPETFRVSFTTNEGVIEVEFVREWSPIAVARVHELGGLGYWDGARIYRVNERYAQFGYSGDPELDARWIPSGLPDEPPLSSNVRGTVSFARGGPGTPPTVLQTAVKGTSGILPGEINIDAARNAGSVLVDGFRFFGFLNHAFHASAIFSFEPNPRSRRAASSKGSSTLRLA